MKKRIAFLIALTLLLLLLLPLAAEGTSVSYEDLKASMQSSNTTLRKADQQIIQSNLDVKDAKAAYQPTIDLTLTGTYMPNPPIDRITISANQLSSILGLDTLGYTPVGYYTLYDGMESTYYNAAISLTQPLFTWGKIPQSVKLYQNIADISVIQREDTENQLTAELKARLAALKYMDQILVLLDETQDLADQLVDAAQDGFDNGMLLKQDVAEARVSALEVEVNRNEIMQQYSSVLQGVRTLTADADLVSADIDFTIDEAEINAVASMDEDVLRQAAISGDSAPLRMLKKQTATYELKKSIANRSMYWNPDFALQITANYGGSRFPGETNWSMKDDWGLYITLAVKTTIWDGGKKINEQKRSDSQIQSSYADYDAAVEQLAATAEENIASMNLALAKIDYLELKKESDESRLELLEIQNEAGSVANTDVLQQRIEVKTTEMEIIQQKINLAQAVYTLEYLARL